MPMQTKYVPLIEKVLRENEQHGLYLRMVQRILDELRNVIVKQKAAVTYFTLGLFTHGPQKPLTAEDAKATSKAMRMGVCAHALLEGNPGRAKTILCEYGAALIKGIYQRIQLTVDVEPSGVNGAEIINPVTGSVRYRRGPIFSNILLADEINRTSPKTQAAMLEAMPEGQISRDVLGDGGETVKRTELLPRPFYVVATQNPIEQKGTFPLPEAQKDRFALQINMTGIAVDDAMEVARINEEVYRSHFAEPVITPQEVLAIMQFISEEVVVSPLMGRYMARLAKSLVPHNDLPKGERETDAFFLRSCAVMRKSEFLIGKRSYRMEDLVSDAMYERMTIVMRAASKTMAFMRGRLYVRPEDIRKIFPLVARHRLFLKPLAEGLLQQQPLTDEGRLLVKMELIDQLLETAIRYMHVPLREM